MTWYLDPDTGDIYDHEGTVIKSVSEPFAVPDDIYKAMLEAKDGNQPSAYNQSLLMDAATDNIERGSPGE